MDGTYDVAIIGGGVIGLTTAWMWGLGHSSFICVDRGDFGKEASWAGAGILPPGDPDKAATPYDWLRAETAADFGKLSAELLEATDIDNGYRVCGSLDFDTPPTGLSSAWKNEGIRLEKADAADASFKAIRFPSQSGLWFPDAAQVRNPRHMRALETACRESGTPMLSNKPIERFTTHNKRITGAVTSDGSTIKANRFILCAGSWTDQLLEPLGFQTGIHPVRGQIALFKEGKPSFDFVVEHGRNYIVPRGDGHVLVGSTEEPEAGFQKGNTREAIDSLVEFAYELVPSLRDARLERTWSGLRPGSPDGLPFIGPAPGFENLFVAGGHFRSGIQTSIATAKLLNQLLDGREPAVDIAPFRVGRPIGPKRVGLFRS